MLNSLPLILIMILSLFLAFYCVDSHKDNIVKVVDLNEKNISKEVYVEVLAIEDKNESDQISIEAISQIIKVTKFKSQSLSKDIIENNSTNEIKKVVPENTKEYELDELERIIKEELNKESKD
jgi:hypothetical protein